MIETRWTAMMPTVLCHFWGEKKWVCTHYQYSKGLKSVTSCIHSYFMIEMNHQDYTAKKKIKIKPILTTYCFLFWHLITLLFKWTNNSLGVYKIPPPITRTELGRQGRFYRMRSQINLLVHAFPCQTQTQRVLQDFILMSVIKKLILIATSPTLKYNTSL